MPRAGKLYLLAMPLPVAAVVLGLSLVRSPANAVDVWLALALVVVAAVAAQFPVEVTPRHKADLSPALYFACALIYTPLVAMALVGASRIAGEGVLCLRRNAQGRPRRDAQSLIFNVSMIMLAAGAASALYQALSAGSPARYPQLQDSLAAVAAALAMYGVSTLLTVIAVGIHVHRNPFAVWLSIGRIELVQNAGLYMAGGILAVIAPGRAWMVLLIMVPAAGIQLSLKRSVQLAKQTVDAVEALADLVDRRDPYTFAHSQHVATSAAAIARRLRLSQEEVGLVELAARVHDLGKIGVPDSVLNKEGRLTEAEFELMKQHPVTGAEILSKYPEYRKGRELVLAHHERMDGLGYPSGLRGDQIPLGARIIAVADSWDAMTSNRPYRAALPEEVALAELERGKGRQWDARVVDAFMEVVTGRPQARPAGWADRAKTPAVRALGAAVGLLG